VVISQSGLRLPDTPTPSLPFPSAGSPSAHKPQPQPRPNLIRLHIANKTPSFPTSSGKSSSVATPFSPFHNQLPNLPVPWKPRQRRTDKVLISTLTRPHLTHLTRLTHIALFLPNTTHYASVNLNLAIHIPRTRRNNANLHQERLWRQ
jgi:hypothetical protein